MSEEKGWKSWGWMGVEEEICVGAQECFCTCQRVGLK